MEALRVHKHHWGLILRVLRCVQVQTDVAYRRVVQRPLLKGRLTRQLVRSEGLRRRLGRHVVQLKGVRVREMILRLLLWEVLLLHVRLEAIETGGWMSSMQSTVHGAFRGRHGQRSAQTEMERRRVKISGCRVEDRVCASGSRRVIARELVGKVEALVVRIHE